MINRYSPYFDWLVSLTGELGSQYQSLLSIAHTIFFYEIIPNDENRVQDGLDLRAEYTRISGKTTNFPQECTFLEMLIGVARRMDYLAKNENDVRIDNTRTWFWALISNLDLVGCTDDILDRDFALSRNVMRSFSNVVDRYYHSSGKGGLFPLQNSKKDQRDVEIWGQMNYWLSENVFS